MAVEIRTKNGFEEWVNEEKTRLSAYLPAEEIEEWYTCEKESNQLGWALFIAFWAIALIFVGVILVFMYLLLIGPIG